MPLYICNSESGVIPEAVKAGLARELTDIHCEVTGAPKTFVNVFFFDGAATGTQAAPAVFLFGSIRAGRTDAQKRNLRQRMGAAIAKHAQLAAEAVQVDTIDVPASWVMEGGVLLPEPGEEDAWMAAHSSA